MERTKLKKDFWQWKICELSQIGFKKTDVTCRKFFKFNSWFTTEAFLMVDISLFLNGFTLGHVHKEAVPHLVTLQNEIFE